MDESPAARWTTADGQQLASEVLQRLRTGRSLNRMSLDTWGGRVDLRGLTTAPARPVEAQEHGRYAFTRFAGVIQIERLRLADVDLSDSRLPGWLLFDSVIDNCRFDRADCSDWSLWRTSVRNTSFHRADLHNAGIGTVDDQGRGNTWTATDFRRADLSGAVIVAATMDGCDFSDAHLDNVRFGQCALRRCTFAGRLSKVFFDGRDLSNGPVSGGLYGQPAPGEMQAVDFSRATFDQVEFRGYQLTGITLPTSPSIRRIPHAREVAGQALTLLAAQQSGPAVILRAVLENRLRGPGTPDEADVFNRDDYRSFAEVGSPELAELADAVITAAQAHCARPKPR
jgi:uncharacterized protein YjbI with pentapeptide repeats